MVATVEADPRFVFFPARGPAKSDNPLVSKDGVQCGECGRKPKARVEHDRAKDYAEVVQERADGIQDEAMPQLRECGNGIGGAKKYRLQQKDSYEKNEVGARSRVGKAGCDKRHQKRREDECRHRDDRHARKKDSKNVPQKRYHQAFVFALEPGEYRQERIERKKRRDGSKKKIRDAERRIVEVECVPRAERTREQPVAQECQYLGGKRERGEKIRGLVHSAHLGGEKSEWPNHGGIVTQHTNPPCGGFVHCAILASLVLLAWLESKSEHRFRFARLLCVILTLFVLFVPLGSGSASTPTSLGFTAQ